MKRLRRWSLYLAAVLVLSATPVSDVLAQTGRATIVGVIDIQAVLRESAAVKSLSNRIDIQRQTAQGATRDREAALRAADLELAQRRSSLQPDQYAKEREALEAEGAALQREVQVLRRQLDQMFSQGMAQVQQVLQQVSQEIARENNLDLIFAKSTIIIVRPEFDFTEEALKRLNARLADVALPETPN